MTDYEEHEVAYGDDKKIFYLAAGPKTGNLVIFVHGWPGIAKTWYKQLEMFAALGFRVLAPDMPGYGHSSARNVHSDYTQENIVKGMLAVLADAGRERALWVGHDWGSVIVWTLANTHPEACRAVCTLCVPYGLGGTEDVLKYVDRDLYPEDRYPFGQWSYQAFYDQDYEKATSFFDKDIHGMLKATWKKTDPASYGKPAFTSDIVRDGGWFGGAEKPPAPEDVPDEGALLPPDIFQELVAAMEKTGFGPGDAWYLHQAANKDYIEKNAKHEGWVLKLPVLFIHARFDAVCHTVSGRLPERMRHLCENLTEAIIDSGHWVGLEKPEETNAALVRWIVEEVTDWWPTYWNGWTKRQTK
ncbi:Epoxide hydrolase A-like protein [Cladobotryum mycophilum]|uniref:Epoxide hydrolase A-like protein n=1 Tax=Cladobotryum mycophilum TaxID=491253 RepID=A0ABR0T4F4_9HYPO